MCPARAGFCAFLPPPRVQTELCGRSGSVCLAVRGAGHRTPPCSARRTPERLRVGSSAPGRPRAPSSPRAQRLTLAAAGGNARALEGERGPSPPAQSPGARGREGGGADVPGPTEASRRHPRGARPAGEEGGGPAPSRPSPAGGHEGRGEERVGTRPAARTLGLLRSLGAFVPQSGSAAGSESRPAPRARALASAWGSPGG